MCVRERERGGELEQIRRDINHHHCFRRANFISARARFVCSSDRAKPSESKDNLNRSDRLPPWNLISS